MVFNMIVRVFVVVVLLILGLFFNNSGLFSVIVR